MLSLTPHRTRVWLLYLTGVLLLMGHLMLFSATGVMALHRHGGEFYYLSRQALCAGIGIALMFAVSRVSVASWFHLRHAILGIQIVLVAATLFSPLAIEAQGASRWLRIGSLRFQPSELAKITVAIYFAGLLAQCQGKPWKWVAAQMAPLGLLLLLIVQQPDLGTTVLLTTMVLAMLFVSGMRPLYFGGLIGSGAAVFGILMLTSDYRRRRLLAFLNPWEDPQGIGFQSIQSFLSFHSGSLFGVGIGNGNGKLFFLPEVHTDFIFSLVGEELGFLGAMAVLGAFVLFSYLLFKVSVHSRDPFARLLAFGLALSLVLQIAVNIGGVTGLLPVKGLPLPFFSWGRSALLAHFVCMGILLNILRQSEIMQPNASR